jgi:hypothetical protein
MLNIKLTQSSYINWHRCKQHKKDNKHKNIKLYWIGITQKLQFKILLLDIFSSGSLPL